MRDRLIIARVKWRETKRYTCDSITWADHKSGFQGPRWLSPLHLKWVELFRPALAKERCDDFWLVDSSGREGHGPEQTNLRERMFSAAISRHPERVEAVRYEIESNYMKQGVARRCLIWTPSLHVTRKQHDVAYPRLTSWLAPKA